MSQAGNWEFGPLQTRWPDARQLANALRAATPALLFGFRLWASVCLALYVAFWLELDNAFWAGTSAAIVSQPYLGASLRKGWFRMIGTVIGAVAIVVLTACFPQDRVAFLVSLVVFGSACAFVATLLRNFATQSATLAGITAAIIASDQLGATGGLNGQAFMLAVTRVSEICIGIVCAGIVLAGTDLGGAPRRLAALFAAIAAEIAGRFTDTLSRAGAGLADTQQMRRELVRRVIALDPVIDQAIGESSRIRYRSPILQRAVDGLIAAVAGWRMVTLHLEHLPDDQARTGAQTVLRWMPQELRVAPLEGEPDRWIADTTHLGGLCGAAVQALIAQPADTPSLRLLVDQTAAALAGVSQALDGLALLVDDPARPLPRRRHRYRLRVPDWLPACVNAARAFVTIGVVALIWIVTAWPDGATAVVFATIGTLVLALNGDQAYASAMGFTIGTCLAAAAAAIVKFAVLPAMTGFAGFSVVIGLVLVPAGALMVQPWRTAVFTSLAFFFVPLLMPANQMSYDTQQFYNTASAIVAGLGTAALSFRLLTPLPPALRTRRLLALTLRDLRRLAAGSTSPAPEDWQSRVYGRLFVLPNMAEPLQRSELVAALSAGCEIIQLHRTARRLDLGADLDAALAAVAQGNTATAIARLRLLDHALASRPSAGTEAPIALGARASIIAMSETLSQYAAYFEGGMPR